MPNEKLSQRIRVGQVNEVSLIQDAGTFLEREFDAEISVNAESDPWVEDPENRSQRAKPYRPAIYVE